ncbi:MAG: hypothetical protein U0930_16290 [Pirellulales bacterium]
MKDDSNFLEAYNYMEYSTDPLARLVCRSLYNQMRHQFASLNVRPNGQFNIERFFKVSVSLVKNCILENDKFVEDSQAVLRGFENESYEQDLNYSTTIFSAALREIPRGSLIDATKEIGVKDEGFDEDIWLSGFFPT